MNFIQKTILILLINILLLINNSYANVDLIVSPIKYEIEAEVGKTITKTAKLINLSNSTIKINTGTSDFESKGTNGKPTFVKKHSSELTGQEVSDWITISESSFTLGPKEEREIEFYITIPNNATPGGHYGAVFFKHDNSNSKGQIAINVDYGILILINVAGEVLSKATVLDFLITENSSLVNKRELDSCFLNIDLTNSKYDNKCFEFSSEFLKTSILNIKTDKNLEENFDKNYKFKIAFEVPIENNGNTHIKPSGQIILIDENGKEIKAIGKKIIQNDKGVIIGEEIVDYIPINDIGGNILPSTKRIFNNEWKGFPYKSYDDEGNPLIQYWNPDEFYSQQNIGKNNVIMPWEKENERISKKNITAKLNINYYDHNGEKIEFNSAKDFSIEYKEKYIGLNPLAIIIGILSVFGILTLWLILRKKKIKCISCNKKIEKEMKICPYCGEKQKKKSSKKKKIKTTKIKSKK